MISLKNYIITLIIFILTDLSWIALNYNYYMATLLKIQKEPFVVKIPPIIVSYLSLGTGLYIYLKFLSLISLEDNNSKKNNYLNSILYGFLFGFAIYGTYSYTCCTYFKNYKYYDAFKDTLWGVVLFIICGLFYTYLSSFS